MMEKSINFFAVASKELVIDNFLSSIYIGNEQYNIYSIESYTTDKWIAIIGDKLIGKVLVYKESNVDNIPLEFFEFNRTAEKVPDF